MAAMYESMGNSSPHTRRYFPNGRPHPIRVALFSAHAEVFPPHHSANDSKATLLRTRGGISVIVPGIAPAGNSSPHTRRYFQAAGNVGKAAFLFSAHAEVFPWESQKPLRGRSLLRTRGGISDALTPGAYYTASSPHTRRYFLFDTCRRLFKALFSAHAEGFPTSAIANLSSKSLLRTRGGISRPRLAIERSSLSSPHTRRYFPDRAVRAGN